MTGNQFLSIYAAVLVLTWIWSLFSYRSSRKPPVNPGLLQPEHWAILSGGLPRAALTSFTQLLQKGTIVWNGEQSRYEPKDPEGKDPIVQLLPDNATLQDAIKSLAEAHRPAEEQLENWGLRWNTKEYETQRMIIFLPFVILLGAGVWRVFLGIARDQPFGFVLMLMFVALLFWLHAAKTQPRNTREGRNLLNTFTRDNDHILRATPGSELVLAVALLGDMALEGSEFERLRGALNPASNGGGLADGLVMSCGSSGSGGDGGGSGCGGCGGGD
ncbi:MAG TPA: TIGR04222 domain-containing membrane protein [Oligoflexus sp.]|uniref:TIGR04222 domain-containing membrane protein n=1 Tax=Oligoflexus sp. TaxID=1971216 RepID=UPI002D350FD1|nr:TIGR04222 domain-containing membrane protein [Oligoflexus sp.]HYX36582.1 TIGR04222 domain-containing membrane protein [Oligoflexus sp.]